MSRAEEIVTARLLEPFREKKYGYVGMEFEFPLISIGGEVSLKEAGSRFLKELVVSCGYTEEIIGTDGYYVRVTKDGDSVSFDFSYSVFELSMGKQDNLFRIRARMLPVLRQAQDYYRKYGYCLTGMGTRPWENRSVEYTFDPFYIMIRQFIRDYALEKDWKQCFPNMCSVQTHVDVPYDHILDTYNLFNRMDFVRGLLFSNSPDRDCVAAAGAADTKDAGKAVNCCVRDVLWERSGIPNTGIYDETFGTLEDLARAISREEIFVKATEQGLSGMKPRTLVSYFEDGEVPEDNIRFFRSFKRVVLNSYHVLEVRGDCTQPVKESFVTAAFHVGIAYRYQKAAALIESFFARNGITASNSALRARAIAGKEIAREEEVRRLLQELVETAAEGLGERGLGEEVLLAPLRERAYRLTNPAKEMLKALGRGEKTEDIMKRYGEG